MMKAAVPARHLGTIELIAVLVGFLALAIFYAVSGFGVRGIAMSKAGWISLVFGVGFSFVVGAGLMALLFYSSRTGYDQPPHYTIDGDNNS